MEGFPGIDAGASFDGLYYKFGFLGWLQFNDYPVVAIFWNLLLLIVPILAMRQLEKISSTGFKTRLDKLKGLAWGFLWLMFFPNTAYIITDVRHLVGACPVNQYRTCLSGVMPMIFFFSYALVGWISFVWLLKHMADFLKKIWGRVWSQRIINITIPLTALGVLLGLIDRWNSWQIFLMPIQITKSAWNYIVDCQRFGVWLGFTLFMYILYYAGLRLFVFAIPTDKTQSKKVSSKRKNKQKKKRTKK